MNFGAEHVIHILTVDGEREVEVLHPESCEEEPGWDGMVLQRLCGISSMLNEGGIEFALGADVRDGHYLARFWLTHPAWAGSEPVDADAGIELVRVHPVDDSGQLILEEERLAGRAEAAADVEAFAKKYLVRVLEVVPQMTGCVNRSNLATIETYRRAASIARVGDARNISCSNCQDTRGGPMGHSTEACAWVRPEGMFEIQPQCLGDESLSVVKAARALLDLKDGPRDELHEAAELLAWNALRDVLAIFDRPDGRVMNDHV